MININVKNINLEIEAGVELCDSCKYKKNKSIYYHNCFFYNAYCSLWKEDLQYKLGTLNNSERLEICIQSKIYESLA